MNFLSILLGVRKALRALWNLALHHPWQAGLIVALVSCGWQTWRLSTVERKLIVARAQIASIRNAQKQAAKDQATVNHEPARRSAAIAEVSNATAPVYLDAVRRASGDRVRKPVGCPTSAADMPRADSAAVGDDQDAGFARMVSVAAEDWDKLVAASGQAAMCVRAGQALIESGVAVASVDDRESPIR